MKLYKRMAENGMEHVVQAESDEVAARLGFVPVEPEVPEPEAAEPEAAEPEAATKQRKPANKAAKPETKAEAQEEQE